MVHFQNITCAHQHQCSSFNTIIFISFWHWKNIYSAVWSWTQRCFWHWTNMWMIWSLYWNDQHFVSPPTKWGMWLSAFSASLFSSGQGDLYSREGIISTGPPFKKPPSTTLYPMFSSAKEEYVCSCSVAAMWKWILAQGEIITQIGGGGSGVGGCLVGVMFPPIMYC